MDIGVLTNQNTNDYISVKNKTKKTKTNKQKDYACSFHGVLAKVRVCSHKITEFELQSRLFFFIDKSTQNL